MLPEKLVFVDIETTGLSAMRDRIIEIGLLRVENNRVVDTYQSLLNPHVYISPTIESITGISKNDLINAPDFEEVSNILQSMMSDAIFAAHNVRFDYSFLRNEFQRMGLKFSAKHFCTAKLSRRLFPKFRHHNLDSIIDRFSIKVAKRHRAFDDAKVLWDFFQQLQIQIPQKKLEIAFNFCLNKPSLPSNLSTSAVDNLPDCAGVYIFYGDKNIPLYVGKSKHIRERVLSHFTNDLNSSKEMNLSRQVRRIDAVKTPGELSALLLESRLIKDMQPIYNRVLRISRKLVILKKSITHDGYYAVKLETVDTILHEELKEIIGIYKSKKQAKSFLQECAKNHLLCEKLLGLENTLGACFSYRLHSCKGACLKIESSIRYNLRFLEAFTRYKIKTWPFSGPVIIKETDEAENIEENIVIDNWCLLGNVTVKDDVLSETKEIKHFDLDIYKILVRYLQNSENYKSITHISREKMQSMSQGFLQ